MAKRLAGNSWTVMAAAALGVLLGQSSWAAEPDDVRPTVRVSVEDPGDAFGKELARARSIVEDLYARAGITLRWVGTTGTTSDHPSLRVVVKKSTAMPRSLTAEAIGVAPTPADGTRGSLAYVFSDRVIAFAQSNRLFVTSVLGLALAHEIGHLLLPANAHTADGIMRANWNPALFQPRAPGLPGFVPEQARLLRFGALSR